MHMTMPTHSAAKWYQRQVRCAAVVGARSSFQSWVLPDISLLTVGNSIVLIAG